VNIDKVGHELGVRYVLEGSVRKAGHQVRINAQLIDVDSGGHVWAERYDRDLEDIFNLQDEVSDQIVSALALKLTPVEQQQIRKRGTVNLNAYDTYLRGLEYAARFTYQTNETAREFFQKALDLDPGFAAAYAKLGWTYFIDWSMGWTKDRQCLDLAMTSARQALAADKSLSEAHCLMANVLVWQKKHDEAIRSYEQSLDLDPNNAEALTGMGDALTWAGRPAEAIPLIEEAMRLNPRYPVYYLFQLGHAYYLTYRYEEAIKTLQASLNRNPDFFPSGILLAAVYGEMDQKIFAQNAMQQVLKLVPKTALEDQARRLPYKDPANLKRIMDALAKAGF
jgi:adenylate cyclase